MAKCGDLRVWWIPQVPMNPFQVNVRDIEQAIFLLRVLADYDKFQFENNIKPDYCNVGGLEVFRDGEWEEWEDDQGYNIGDIRSLAELAPTAEGGK